MLRTVLFAPEDLALVRGDPSERRRLLDEVLVMRTPRLAGTRADYDRVLKQRNALLKSGGGARRSGGDLATLDVWDEHLATVGAELLASRWALVEELRPQVVAAYADLAGGTIEAGPGVPVVGAAAGGRTWLPTPVGRVDAAAMRRGRWCRSWVGCGPPSWTAASRWPGRTATSWSCPSVRASPVASRRTGSPGPWRWRCGSAHSRSCAPTAWTRCWYWTTCSPSSTQCAATGSRPWSPDADQVLITAAVAADVPEILGGARLSVADGAVIELD